MNEKLLAFLKKNYILILLFLVLVVGIFLRSYHFGDWLHFELDQSRDAKVIDLALDEGISNLPLLGPKAAGTFLRLGPIFYYFEYISAKIFGGTPSGQVALSLIFSCLTIPILYFFLKRYFEKNLSLLLTFLFSVSIFFIMYSRFGWNPNNLPFFVILTFLALLKFCDSLEKRRGLWMIIFAIAISCATQLHFLAFTAIPAISIIFLIIKRPGIKAVHWITSIFIVLLFYSPTFLNEYKTGGKNFGQLKEVFLKKSDNKHGKFETMYKNYTEQSLGYFLLISGRGDAEMPRMIQQSRLSYKYICDEKCKMRKNLGITTCIFFGLGLILLAIKIFKNFGEKPSAKKDFLILSSLWFIVTYLAFFSIAYDISPRFFLLTAALPFVFLGLIFETLLSFLKNRYFAWGLVLASVGLLVFFNVSAIQKRFSELKRAPYESFDIAPDRILKERTRVTLLQQYMISDFMVSIQKQNGWPIYLNSEPFYRRSFLYHIARAGIKYDDFRNLQKKVYKNGNYFLIYPTLSNLDKRVGKYLDQYEIIQEKKFGTLTLWQLYPKAEFINFEEQIFETKNKPTSQAGVPQRFRWEEIFNDASQDEEEVDE